jgi:hypothetical protein
MALILPLKPDPPGGAVEGYRMAPRVNAPPSAHSRNAGGQATLISPKPPALSEPITVLDPSTLKGKPIRHREWIVPDWLPVGSVTLCYADGGVGKTLLAQQLMGACAIGGSWCGLNVMQCRSIGFFCEDDPDELHFRQSRINAAMGIAFSDLSETRWVSGVGEDNLLLTFDRNEMSVRTHRFEEIRSLAISFRARLVVVDTAADTFGGNENDRSQVRQFVGRTLTRLAQDIGGAVLLNAHPSRAGLAAGGDQDGGSTAWNNSARSRWAITRQTDTDGPPDPDARLLSRRKSNYASTGATIPLRWCDGVLMTTAARPSDAPAEDRRAAAEEVFMSLLARCDASDMPLSTSQNASNFAPKTFAKRPDRQGLNRKDFDQAMHALLASGRIRLAIYGRKGDERRRIVACNPGDAADQEDAAE